MVAHIPPGAGLNQVVYGGIFFPEPVSGKDRTRLAALPLGPDLTRWMTEEPDACPVERHRSSSQYGSLHDTTLLKVKEDGTLWSRKPLPEKGKISDAEALKAMLTNSKIPAEKIPTGNVLTKWLDSSDESPLRLRDGTPVKSIWEKNPKGNFHPPFGVTAKRGEDGQIREAKIITEKFDALEIWEGLETEGKRAGKRIYQKRLVPVDSTLKALTQLGFSWRKCKAPAEFQKHPDQPETHLTFREIICGSLLPYSKRRHTFRKGQVYRIGLTKEGGIAPRGQKPYWSCWYYVSALIGSSRIELKALQYRDKENTPIRDVKKNFLTLSPQSVDVLAQIANLPSFDDPSLDSAG